MVIYLDSGDLEQMKALEVRVSGFTTNPTLLKQGKVKNYKEFALKALEIAKGKPISFEVFADHWDEMEDQARHISAWGKNIYVKIPVVTTNGESTVELIKRISDLKLNITAIMTPDQIFKVCDVLRGDNIISIFAGRMADTGVAPESVIWPALQARHPGIKILWASTREAYNAKQADRAQCDIITVSPEILKKMELFGKDLREYSVETVRQFKKDAEGLSL